MTSLPPDLMTPRFDEYGYAMVVAGGADGGACPAVRHLAIATLAYLVRRFGDWNLRIDDATAREIMDRAERWYQHIDVSVTSRRHVGMGRADHTTLTAAFGAGRDLFLAHVGHSKAYLSRRGHLVRLTCDRTASGRHTTGLVSAAAPGRDHGGPRHRAHCDQRDRTAGIGRTDDRHRADSAFRRRSCAGLHERPDRRGRRRADRQDSRVGAVPGRTVSIARQPGNRLRRRR